MTRVTFYIHDRDSDTELWVCRLLDKIQRSGNTCFVWIPDDPTRNSLDRRLWTWEPGSFTAHEMQSGGNTAEAPIVISAEPPTSDNRQTLLVWRHPGDTPPEFFSSYERCLEIVAGSEDDKRPARQRYKFYRDRGYAMETHNITPNT